jgi:hypothetical protein
LCAPTTAGRLLVDELAGRRESGPVRNCAGGGGGGGGGLATPDAHDPSLLLALLCVLSESYDRSFFLPASNCASKSLRTSSWRTNAGAFEEEEEGEGRVCKKTG